MKLNPTWVINFGDASLKNEINDQLSSFTENFTDWFICENIETYCADLNAINDFFDKEKYKDIFKAKLESITIDEENNKAVDRTKWNIILLGDIEDQKTRELMTLFAFKLNLTEDQVIEGNGFLLGATSLNVKAVIFSKNDWDEKETEANKRFLFELNLLQGIPIGPMKPFDAILFFKDINTIGNFGGFLNKVQHGAKLAQLILHLSLKNTKVLSNKVDYNYATFGGATLYFDSDELIENKGKEVANIILSKIKSSNDGSLFILSDSDTNDYINSLVNDLSPTTIFKSLGAVTNPYEYQSNERKGDPHSWFELSRLKTFFLEDIKYFLRSLLQRRSTFMTTVFINLKKDLKVRTEKQLEYIKNLKKDPALLASTVFKEKSTSISGLRKLIEKYKLLLQKNIDLAKELHKNNFTIDENGEKKEYEPFPIVGKCKKYYDEFVLDLDEKSAIECDDKEKIRRSELLKKLENLPHPLSYFIRSIILGSLLIMLFFIPINNYLEGNDFRDIILIIILSFVFTLPIFAMYLAYNSKVNGLNEEEIKYEALIRYIARRKVIYSINNEISSLYDRLISDCDNYVSLLDDFCRKENPVLEKKYSKFIETDYAVKINEKITTKISCKIEDFDMNQDITNEVQVFDLWKRIVSIDKENDSFDLDKLINNHDDFVLKLNEIIMDMIAKTKGNTICIADLVLNDGQNSILPNEWEKIVNKVIPFYNSLDGGDIDWEIKMFPNEKDVSLFKVSNDLKFNKLVQTNAKPDNIKGFRSNIASFLAIKETNSGTNKLTYIFRILKDEDIINIISSPLSTTTQEVVKIYINTLLNFDKQKYAEFSTGNKKVLFSEFKNWNGNSIESLFKDDYELSQFIKSTVDTI
jgi:hypothetical protein